MRGAGATAVADRDWCQVWVDSNDSSSSFGPIFFIVSFFLLVTNLFEVLDIPV